MGNAVPVSTQEYKGGGGGRLVILFVASWHRNRDELQLDGSLGSSVVPFTYK